MLVDGDIANEIRRGTSYADPVTMFRSFRPWGSHGCRRCPSRRSPRARMRPPICAPSSHRGACSIRTAS